MTSVRRHLPLLLTLCACGQAPETPLGPTGGPETPSETTAPTTDPQPGPRLRARYIVADEGGAKRLLHLVDTVTGAPCHLIARRDTEAEDRVCVPLDFGQVLFLDDECNTPYIEARGEAPRWVTAYGQAPMAGPARLGAPLQSSAGPVYMNTTRVEGCVEVTRQDPSVPLYAVEAFVGFDDLPNGRVEVEEQAGMRIERLVTDDGFAVVLNLVDVVSGTRCHPEATDAGPRCAPDIGEIRDYGIRNQACSAIVVQEYTNPGVARVRGEDGPPLRFEALVDGTPIGYPTGDGGCREEPGNYGRSRPYVGIPHPPEAWPVLDLAQHGGPRLLARPGVFADGQSAERVEDVDPRRMFVDVDDAVACGPAFVEGSLRCVPDSPDPWVPYDVFADPECTRPAIIVGPDVEPPTFVTKRDTSRNIGGLGLPEARVFAVREQIEMVYEGGEEACRPYPGRGDYYGLGEAIEASPFAPLHLEPRQ